MRVITLTPRSFSVLCRKLRETVDRSGYRYDTLVGIATGGDYVAREFDFPVTFSVSRHRPGTQTKQGVLAPLLRRLPSSVNAALRMAESAWLGVRDTLRPPEVKPVTIEGNLAVWLREAPRRVLIVDDALDSGATMLAVIEGIRAVAPDTIIKTAVITVTRRLTLIHPDYTLFDNRTLVRFPWSSDVKR